MSLKHYATKKEYLPTRVMNPWKQPQVKLCCIIQIHINNFEHPQLLEHANRRYYSFLDNEKKREKKKKNSLSSQRVPGLEFWKNWEF